MKGTEALEQVLGEDSRVPLYKAFSVFKKARTSMVFLELSVCDKHVQEGLNLRKIAAWVKTLWATSSCSSGAE
jgi:hypothetical protein